MSAPPSPGGPAGRDRPPRRDGWSRHDAPSPQNAETRELIHRIEAKRARRRKWGLVLGGLGAAVLAIAVTVGVVWAVGSLAGNESQNTVDAATATTTAPSTAASSAAGSSTTVPATTGSVASTGPATGSADAQHSDTTTAPHTPTGSNTSSGSATGSGPTAGLATTKTHSVAQPAGTSASAPTASASTTTSQRLTGASRTTTTVARTTTTKKAAAAPAAPPTAAAAGKKIVVIDPGHQARGNYDLEPIGPGSSQKKAKVTSGTAGVVTGIPESELVLDVGLRLRDKLEAAGVKVVMTRTKQDVNISNSQRAKIANEAGADLFVRVHADGSDNSNAQGIHVLYPVSIKGWTDDIATPSKRAAQLAQKELIAATGAKDRGIDARDDMAGFNWSDVPAIIPEIGFMTNPAEDRLLATDAYRDKVATALAKAILSHLGLR